MKIEFKYSAEVGRQIIEGFADAHSFPFEKRELNNGMLWKYILTTGDVSQAVFNVYRKADGSMSSLYMEKGNPAVLEQLLIYATGDEGGKTKSNAKPRIGIDEAGKGDYFGPLVIAAVGLMPDNEARLRAVGVADSKTLSDKNVAIIADKIASMCPHSVISIGPQKYNELYEKFRNLNKLLAWGHARALENVLEAGSFEIAISDQFSSRDLLKRSLFERGRQIKLIERPRAESDAAVAAASILARDGFLRGLYNLSRQSGVKLPKGCSETVKVAGKELVRKLGQGELGNYAKLHFRTTASVVRT